MKQSASVPYEDILYDSLKDKNEAAAYLELNLKRSDVFFFLVALRNVVNANGGILALSRKTGLSRPNLYRMLSQNGNPEVVTLNKILRTLGLTLAVKPLGKAGVHGPETYRKHRKAEERRDG